jgi:hypothetical protein
MKGMTLEERLAQGCRVNLPRRYLLLETLRMRYARVAVSSLMIAGLRTYIKEGLMRRASQGYLHIDQLPSWQVVTGTCNRNYASSSMGYTLADGPAAALCRDEAFPLANGGRLHKQLC